MRTALDLAAPIRCVACDDASDGELCGSCAGRITVVRRPFCERCGLPNAPARCPCAALEGFVRARSLVAFAEPARSLTLAMKRRGRPALVRDVGSLVAALAIREELSCDVVCFVPAGRRARHRGFDPARLLAAAVARRLGVPMRPLLARIDDGPRQADVAMSARRANVRGRFDAKRADGTVLLVDDVYTTGATAEACSVALVRAGASEVNVLTWARTLRRLYLP